MSATAEQVRRIRRMVGEATADTYTDDDLAAYIERYPIVDKLGNDPFQVDDASDPATVEENEDWTPTYDLNSAAADIWSEKAAALAARYDFNAGGQSFSRSQAYAQYMQQARYFQSRRAAGTITQWPAPKRSAEVVFNESQDS